MVTPERSLSSNIELNYHAASAAILELRNSAGNSEQAIARLRSLFEDSIGARVLLSGEADYFVTKIYGQLGQYDGPHEITYEEVIIKETFPDGVAVSFYTHIQQVFPIAKWSSLDLQPPANWVPPAVA